MKIDEIKLMSDDQRSDELVKLKKEHFNLRFQRASGQLENTARLRQIRRTIARIKTIAKLSSSGKLNQLTAKTKTTKTKTTKLGKQTKTTKPANKKAAAKKDKGK